MKRKLQIEKSVFQIKHSPRLSFYENLFKQNDLFSKFPDWQTDRLKLILRDYKKFHSVTIQFDSITFESDSYKKSLDLEIINAIDKDLLNIIQKDDIRSFGRRFYCLVDAGIDFKDLVNIINLKYFSRDFVSDLKESPTDSTITITSEFNNLKYRLQVGPMRSNEVQRFIKLNVENHINLNTPSGVEFFSKIHEKYPAVSFFIDLDITKEYESEDDELLNFYKDSDKAFTEITSKLIDYTFKEKLNNDRRSIKI